MKLEMLPPALFETSGVDEHAVSSARAASGALKGDWGRRHVARFRRSPAEARPQNPLQIQSQSCSSPFWTGESSS